MQSKAFVVQEFNWVGPLFRTTFVGERKKGSLVLLVFNHTCRDGLRFVKESLKLSKFNNYDLLEIVHKGCWKVLKYSFIC